MKIFKNLSDWSESDFSDKKFPSEKYDEESNGSVFSKEISNHSKSQAESILLGSEDEEHEVRSNEEIEIDYGDINIGEFKVI